ncbi:uncharacterized protein BYT42DRAFT_579270 [Radiomyces spectabilis]|uniref:uncharacterized protein n=1 Tax=Radiomyces spectabilis TaxID=64574 RepID=UPI002220115C|nr:uncharacterized protein BYT42DRAFT_579270 [Radiomyces spectabilis]KAI8373120.1 hypothetical protein BYT42DRAFT_579270 [Radiomyces spectabilis]
MEHPVIGDDGFGRSIVRSSSSLYLPSNKTTTKPWSSVALDPPFMPPPPAKKRTVPGVSKLVTSVRRLKKSRKLRQLSEYEVFMPTTSEDDDTDYDTPPYLFFSPLPSPPSENTSSSTTSPPPANHPFSNRPVSDLITSPRAKFLLRLRKSHHSRSHPNSSAEELGDSQTSDSTLDHWREHRTHYFRKRKERRQLRKKHRPSFSEPQPKCTFAADTAAFDHYPRRRNYSIKDLPANLKPAVWSDTDSPDMDCSMPQSIPSMDVIHDMSNSVQRFQYLLTLEMQRLEVNKRTIEEYIEKLIQIDANTEYLNTKLTSTRFENMKRMQHQLEETKNRNPLLKESLQQHRRMVRKIEGYHQLVDFNSRLDTLRKIVQSTQRTEAVWLWIRQWGFLLVISVVFALTVVFRYCI